MSHEHSLIIAVYVDDLLIIGNNHNTLIQFKETLSNKFKMKDLGIASFILGIKIEREGDYLYLSQEEYLAKILKRFGMTNSKAIATPLEIGIKILLSNSQEDISKEIDYPYREAIGCLMYAMLCTRPDLSFSICYLSRFSNNPRIEHWKALKRVLRYIKGTIKLKLKFGKESENILGYSDAD